MSKSKLKWPHFLLSVLLLAVSAGGLFLYANPWIVNAEEDFGNVISVNEAHAKAVTGEITLVDIRYPKEWRKTGVPQSGHAITMHQEKREFLAKLEKVLGGDKSKPVAVICGAGGRSTPLQNSLKRAGYSNVYNVASGLFGSKHGTGWLAAKLPVRTWQDYRTDKGPTF